MAEAKYKLEVYISILSDSVSPDEISACLEIEPTATTKKGVQIRPGSGRAVRNIWRLGPQVDSRNSSVDAQFEYLANRLRPFVDNFRRLPLNETVAIIDCVVYAYEDMPEIVFQPDQLEFIASLPAALEVVVHDSRGLE